MEACWCISFSTFEINASKFIRDNDKPIWCSQRPYSRKSVKKRNMHTPNFGQITNPNTNQIVFIFDRIAIQYNRRPNWMHEEWLRKRKMVLLFELQIEKMSRALNFRSESLNIVEDVFGIVIVHISNLLTFYDFDGDDFAVDDNDDSRSSTIFFMFMYMHFIGNIS